MAEAARALVEGEDVHINVLDAEHGAHVARVIGRAVPKERVHLHEIRTDDAWIRDHGAIFVVDEAERDRPVALDFEYNAWGGKYYPYEQDRAVARKMAEIVGVESVSVPMVLEGGSIEVDGAGLLMTTEQCLLNSNRNPELDRGEIETNLKYAFGVDEIVWLGDGIEGDDTDGHVDDLTRFVDTRTVVTAVEENASDPNFAPLKANRRRLEDLRVASGQRLDVIELPMPRPLFANGQRLPASYANFYIANACVLVPVFGSPQDDLACARIGDSFPGRRVVPIVSTSLVMGLGALHCLTQQVPAIVAGSAISYS